jgi:hypothetical protein
VEHFVDVMKGLAIWDQGVFDGSLDRWSDGSLDRWIDGSLDRCCYSGRRREEAVGTGKE